MEKFNLNKGGDTLVLNCDGKPLSLFPISTINWRDAISNLVMDDVDVLEVYDGWVVRSQTMEIQVPAVVMTRKWVPAGRAVRFSSTNVYMRDDYTCQYCNKVFAKDQLTKEHVLPKKLGGRVEWTNIVAACGPCNQRKSHFLDMQPRTKPRKPTYGEMVAKVQREPITVRHASWNTYLQWPEDKVRIVEPRKAKP